MVSSAGSPTARRRILTAADGLPKNAYVMALLEDREGRVWVGTRGGLVRVDPAGPLPLPPMRVYGVRDGLPAPRVESLLQASDGTLWIGTTKGLVAVGPRRGGGRARVRELHAGAGPGRADRRSARGGPRRKPVGRDVRLRRDEGRAKRLHDLHGGRRSAAGVRARRDPAGRDVRRSRNRGGNRPRAIRRPAVCADRSALAGRDHVLRLGPRPDRRRGPGRRVVDRDGPGALPVRGRLARRPARGRPAPGRLHETRRAARRQRLPGLRGLARRRVDRDDRRPGGRSLAARAQHRPRAALLRGGRTACACGADGVRRGPVRRRLDRPLSRRAGAPQERRASRCSDRRTASRARPARSSSTRRDDSGSRARRGSCASTSRRANVPRFVRLRHGERPFEQRRRGDHGGRVGPPLRRDRQGSRPLRAAARRPRPHPPLHRGRRHRPRRAATGPARPAGSPLVLDAARRLPLRPLARPTARASARPRDGRFRRRRPAARLGPRPAGRLGPGAAPGPAARGLRRARLLPGRGAPVPGTGSRARIATGALRPISVPWSTPASRPDGTASWCARSRARAP